MNEIDESEFSQNYGLGLSALDIFQIYDLLFEFMRMYWPNL